MFKRFTCALMFVAASATANAVPVVTYDGGTGYADRILDLEVNGVLYDVDFVGGSYNTVFGGDAPTFFGDASAADAAADAIMNAFNAEASVPEIASGDSEVLWVPFAYPGSDLFRATQVGHDTSTDPWQRYADFVGDTNTDHTVYHSWLFAHFTTQSVPEPATLFLLTAGMLGVGVARRRKA